MTPLNQGSSVLCFNVLPLEDYKVQRVCRRMSAPRLLDFCQQSTVEAPSFDNLEGLRKAPYFNGFPKSLIHTYRLRGLLCERPVTCLRPKSSTSSTS